MKKRIAIVVDRADHGLVYQRLHLPLRNLKEKYDFFPFDIAEFRNSDAFYMDAVVSCHPSGTQFSQLAQRCRYQYKIPFIVDIDDLLTDLPSDHEHFHGFVNKAALQETFRHATAVVTSTDYLKREYGHLNRNISVIENTIDERFYDNYTPPLKPYHSGFVVGWTGSQFHRADHYHTFLPGLMRFLDKYDDARCYFHLVCPDILRRKYGARIIFEPNPCSYLDYPALCSTYPFDVCLVGLDATPFNNAKSDMKLLEMAPHGIPLIASPRENFKRHVGLMKVLDDDSSDSWFAGLEKMYLDKDLRHGLSHNAKEYVMRERKSATASLAWGQVLERSLERGFRPLSPSKLSLVPPVSESAIPFLRDKDKSASCPSEESKR